MTPIELILAACVLLVAIQQGIQMATTQDIQASIDTLTATINRAIPIIQNANGRIDPATLDPLLTALNGLTTALNAVLPPG